jgi:threonine dehydratase
MIPYAWLEEAKKRISPYIHTTPLTYDPDYDLYLKWENHQITGSFKLRGALNKILSLENWEQKAGLLAASAGNHGQGVSFAGKLVGAPVRIFVPAHTPRIKIEAMHSLGAHVEIVSGGYGDAEVYALKITAESNATWVSPYNDGHIIAGQGTVGMEVLQQLAANPEFQNEDPVWIVPASGGGLISGIGAALSTLAPCPKLIAVQSDTSPFLHSLFYRGTQEGIEELPTIAEGLAGAVQEGSITIPMVRQFVDEVILVNEKEIADAISLVWQRYGERIEGAAAVGIAAVFTGKITQRPAIVVLSGGNIQEEVFDKIVGTEDD